MPGLADLQAAVRSAVVEGDPSAVASLLRGGGDARKRLAIHQRHYATSLVTALLDRFPATVWLVGSGLVTDAARDFVRERPPSKPCIAEYGEDFPTFLSSRAGVTQVPYLGEFAGLEWHSSRLALAIELPPICDLSAVDPAHLAETPLAIQPGVHHLHLHWGLDHVIAFYLTDSPPDTYSLEAADVWLEIRGARGQLQMNRMTCGGFAFRAALTAGAPLGDAAMAAVDAEPAFDVGQALMALLSEGLVTAIGNGHEKERHR